jgi:hypothetical protein
MMMGESATARKKPPKPKDMAISVTTVGDYDPSACVVDKNGFLRPKPQARPLTQNEQIALVFVEQQKALGRNEMAASPPRITPMPGHKPSTFESEWELYLELNQRMENVFEEFRQHTERSSAVEPEERFSTDNRSSDANVCI